jgi:hypothetical protein
MANVLAQRNVLSPAAYANRWALLKIAVVKMHKFWREKWE